MTTSHTPGPWTIGQNTPDGGRTVVDAHGRAVTFTPVYLGSAAPDIATAAANARLIAAAPDMLAAMHQITGWMRDHTSPRDANTPHAMLVDACAIIAKIDGAS